MGDNFQLIDRPASATEQGASVAGARYYRPELDILRFIAFFLVFIFHGPYIPVFSILQKSGVYGLGLFFYLSAFLITELLLRESMLFGTVHLRAFYVRRALRIWPLYYIGGVGSALLWSWLSPKHHLSKNEILYLLLFVGFLGGNFHWNPAGVLWSVSVEEMFYAIWPWAGKLRKFGLSVGVAAFVSIVVIMTTNDTWYNPIAQFLFFAGGASTALLTHGKRISLSNGLRLFLFALSMLLFIFGSSSLYGLVWYLIGIVGCLSLFTALIDLRPSVFPPHFIYLGKISFGLYVFHRSCLVIAGGFIDRSFSFQEPVRAIGVHVLAFLMSFAMAATSYQILELPFLRLKGRFEFIKSRPAT